MQGVPSQMMPLSLDIVFFSILSSIWTEYGI
jgi:hypothetical protein